MTRKKSVLELKETAIDVINNVQKSYWELVKTIEELRVRKKSLERAEDLLREKQNSGGGWYFSSH